MKLILVLALLSSVVLAQVPQPLDFDWRNLKDIWEHPRLQPGRRSIESRLGISKRPPTTRNSLERIVGGNNATLGQFPHYVLTVIDGEWWCGSSLVSSNYALTVSISGKNFFLL